jgi:hypothetical protein
MAGMMPKARQGLGMSKSCGSCVSVSGVNLNDDLKTMQFQIMSLDSLLGKGLRRVSEKPLHLFFARPKNMSLL